MAQVEITGNENICNDDKITIVLLGQKTNEKSMIGNSILRADHFKAEENTCTRAEASVDDHKLCVINTPDDFHKEDGDEIEEAKPLYSGPRMFLFVAQDTSLSQKEGEILAQLKSRFGEKMVERTSVVMVGNGQPARELYEAADEKLKKLSEECGKRFYVHNREETKGTELMKQILKNWKMINESVSRKPAAESIYEEINPYEEMKSVPESSCIDGKVKEQLVEKPGSEEMMTVVLLGNISNRKALIGNKLFNKQNFRQDNVMCEKIIDKVEGKNVSVINTPDAFHKECFSDPEAERMKELQSSYRGPRVFLLVLQDKTFSSEEMTMFTNLKKKLGENMVENTIVLVERINHLVTKQMSVKKHYHAILDECGGRKCVYFTEMKSVELIKKLKKYTDFMTNNQLPEGNFSKVQKSIFKQYLETTQAAENSMYTFAKEDPLKTNTIVLLGQSGSGKSATGNTILRKHHFESHASSVPVTQECKLAREFVFEKKIRVVDTPDFFNEDLTNQEEQISKCKELARPGPDVYLLVMQLGRFTEGEREVLPNLKRVFGEDVTSKIVIIFTGKEKLKNKMLSDYIQSSDKELQELVQSCNNRAFAVNNNDKREDQLRKMLDYIFNRQGNTNNPQPAKKKLESQECTIL